MAVCQMVDNGHAVLFDSGGSYALDKRTREKTMFARAGRGWDLELDLEAPEKANKVMSEILAEMRDGKGAEAQEKEPEIDIEKLLCSPCWEEEEDFRLAARPFRA
jgi:hypothetical protein